MEIINTTHRPQASSITSERRCGEEKARCQKLNPISTTSSFDNSIREEHTSITFHPQQMPQPSEYNRNKLESRKMKSH